MNSLTVYSKLVWKGRNLFHFKCSKLTTCAGTRKTYDWMQFVTLPGEQNLMTLKNFPSQVQLAHFLIIYLIGYGKELDSTPWLWLVTLRK